MPLVFWRYKSFTYGQLLAILVVTIILYLTGIIEYKTLPEFKVRI
ncbi:hypothetical protein XCR1_2730010 [Xenorhabdus cabanillasii JM26]|uniref:Uncharacterized protein n=1 Tax=Xenorhabdus cabanillasii JM26 TaxID=1427517 RepID=W1J7V0_9GAMM|nr:hypothetical protein XCR1_2730010 [Xenorhabdus cabanillasii JM26]